MGKWYSKLTLITNFTFTSTNPQFVYSLHLDTTTTLKALGIGNPNRYIQVYLFYHPKEEVQYLTLEKIFLDSKGKKSTEALVENLMISTKNAETLLNTFKYEKGFFSRLKR